MNIDLTVIQTGAIVAVPIIVALVQAVKMTGFISNKFMPLVSIGIGIIIGVVANHDFNDFSGAIMTGIMYGLMASGLYSGLRTTIKEQPDKSDPQAQQNKKQY
jgi:hypothetical protein